MDCKNQLWIEYPSGSISCMLVSLPVIALIFNEARSYETVYIYIYCIYIYVIYGIMCHYIWIYLVLPYYRVLLKVSYVVSSLTSTTDPWCLWEWLNWCSLHSRRGLLCLLLWGLLTSHGSCTRCTPKGGVVSHRQTIGGWATLTQI